MQVFVAMRCCETVWKQNRVCLSLSSFVHIWNRNLLDLKEECDRTQKEILLNLFKSFWCVPCNGGSPAVVNVPSQNIPSVGDN